MFSLRNSLTNVIAPAIILCASLAAVSPDANAQQAAQSSLNEKGKGIRLFEQRETKGAIKALRAAVKHDKDDAESWYYLGLALGVENKTKDAREALEKSVKLRPDFIDAQAALAYALIVEGKVDEAAHVAARVLQTGGRTAEAHYVIGATKFWRVDMRGALAEAEKALATKPDFTPALLLKGYAVRGIIEKEFPDATKEQQDAFIALSQETIAAMKSALKLNPNQLHRKQWEQTLNDLRPYADGQFEDFVYRTKDLTQKARILVKPSPNVGLAKAQGQVVLQAILRRNGEVDNIKVISKTRDELVKPCIEAVRKIKFTPAMKDGRAVSQYIKVEYFFN